MKFKAFIFFLLFASAAMAQNEKFIPQSLGGAANIKNFVPGAIQGKSGIVLVSFADTATANLNNRIKNEDGLVIRVKDTLFLRDTIAKKWVNLSGSGSGSSSNGVDSITQVGSILYVWKAGVSRPHETKTSFTFTPNYNNKLFLLYTNGVLTDSVPSGVKDTYGLGGIRLVDSLGNTYIDGSGIAGGRFGIEDNVGLQDRDIDIQHHDFGINNIKYGYIQSQLDYSNSGLTFDYGAYTTDGKPLAQIFSNTDSNASTINVYDKYFQYNINRYNNTTVSKNIISPVRNGNYSLYIPLSVQVNGTEHFANDSGKIDLGTISGGGSFDTLLVKQLISDSSKRFGIEDNVGLQDRNVDMQGYKLNLSDVGNLDMYGESSGHGYTGWSFYPSYSTDSTGIAEIYSGSPVYGGDIQITPTDGILLSSYNKVSTDFNALFINTNRFAIQKQRASISSNINIPLSVQVNGTEHFANDSGKIDLGTISAGGTTINFIDNEEATGSTASTITLANTPTAGSVKLYKNGVRQLLSKFSVSGATLTLTDTRLSTDTFTLDYRY